MPLLTSHWKTPCLDRQKPKTGCHKKYMKNILLCWGNEDELKTHADRLFFLLYWLNNWNFSLISLSRAQQKVIKRNREFFIWEKEKFFFFQFWSFFSHRLNVENCESQMVERKTVAWKLDQLNYHNIYFWSQSGGKNILVYICSSNFIISRSWHLTM